MSAAAGKLSLEELLERRGRRLRGLLLCLALGCIAGVAVFVLEHEIPARPGGLGDDFRDFYAAGRLVARGLNPYTLRLLQVAEQAAFHYPSLNPVLDSFVDPPIVAWLMVPLTGLGFWAGYGVFTGVGVGLLGLTLTLLARDLGWRHTAILAGAVLASWIGLLGLLDGQLDALVFAALAGSMLLAWHDRCLSAGCVMALVLLKPTLLWPAPIFLFLALWPERRRAQSFALGFLVLAAAWILANWSLLPEWGASLVRFSHSVAGQQPDLAGLPGLLGAAPSSWHLGAGFDSPATISLVALGLATMALFGAWMMVSPDWRRVSPVGRISWAVALPVGIWLLVTPYAHSNDDLLLLPLLMLTLGRDARRIHGLGLSLSVAAVAVLLLIWPARVVPWEVGLALAGLLTGVLWVGRTDPRLTGFGAGLCLLCLILLPPVWAFHQLPVGLTPVAVLILVVEGARTCWIEVGGAGTGPAYYSEPTVERVGPEPAGG